jgi:hypothetical protein
MIFYLSKIIIFTICPLDISRWTRNKGHHLIWQISIYLDILHNIDSNGRQTTLLYEKRDDFDIAIVNIPFLCSNIPLSPAYGVYVSQLIRYTSACFANGEFSKRGRLLTHNLMLQGYDGYRLKSPFPKFYGRYNGLVCDYKLSLAHMLDGLFHTIC